MYLGVLTSFQLHSRSSGLNFISLFHPFHHRDWLSYRHINNQSREGRGDTHCLFCSGRCGLCSVIMARETAFLHLYSRVWGWKGWSWDSHFATIKWWCTSAGDHNVSHEDEAETRESMCLDHERPGLVMSFESQGQLSLKQSFSMRRWGWQSPPHPGDIWLCLEAFLVVRVWSLLLASGVEPRGAAKHPARHRTAPSQQRIIWLKTSVVFVDNQLKNPTISELFDYMSLCISFIFLNHFELVFLWFEMERILTDSFQKQCHLFFPLPSPPQPSRFPLRYIDKPTLLPPFSAF